uniref:Serine and arginine rich splicing factor 4 n=1 Tax=Poecilia latipinna TaxID=48699 RepID=A0A3B3U1D8_9TELE
MSRVYIGRLSYRAREKDVERFFKGTERTTFDDPRDADDAVYDLNGKELCGERVIVEHTKGPRRDGGYTGGRSESPNRGYGRWGGRDRYGPPVRTDYRLIVENLSSRCSWQDLKDYMRQAGEVTYADTHKGRKNEGVIEFRQYSDMKRALEKLDGTEVNGRKIRLIEDRPGSRSRSRSASRSRSRSRSGSKDRPRKSGSQDGEPPKSDAEAADAERPSRSPEEPRARSKSKSKSRSVSPAKAGSRSRSASRSESRSKSRSRSRSRS